MMVLLILVIVYTVCMMWFHINDITCNIDVYHNRNAQKRLARSRLRYNSYAKIKDYFL